MRCTALRVCSFLIIILYMFLLLAYYFDFNETDQFNKTEFIQCRLFIKSSKCIRLDQITYIPSDEINYLFETKTNITHDVLELVSNYAHFHKIPREAFNSLDEYLFFADTNVELREKVKFISVDDGVPVSKQWYSQGHKYPIQIAQYGLSHFSKWKRKSKTHKRSLKLTIFGDNSKLLPRKLPFVTYSGHITKFVKDLEHKWDKFHFDLENEDSGINIHDVIWKKHTSLLNKETGSYLPNFNLKGSDWSQNSALHFKITVDESKWTFNLVYLCTNENIEDFRTTLYFIISNCKNLDLTRSIYHDLLHKLYQMERSVIRKSRVIKINFFGKGEILNFSLADDYHKEKFINAANWFLNNQNVDGSWPVQVQRRFDHRVKLEPGWVSAMAQGQAISLLTRVFNATGLNKYLTAAIQGLAPFETNVSKGGVRTHFMNNADLVWYEEYPVNQGLFVLNGFIYSLIGLRDLTLINLYFNEKSKAISLYSAGIESLVKMLPLFDSGFGTFYDLRHISFPLSDHEFFKTSLRAMEVPNGPNRARWQYHVVHITQLEYMIQVMPIQYRNFLKSTIERYKHYLMGFRSPHN